MNRKQVLKNMKKNKKSKNTVQEENYINSFVTSITVVILLLVISYLFIGIFVTKTISFKKAKEKKEEVVIDNTTILAGTIFDQKESEYYVLVYDTTDKKSMLPSWKDVYSGKEGALPIYIVDSSKKLNANFIVEKDSNKDATGYDNLKIVSPTLIRIKDKAISEYIEGNDNIKNVFKK